MNTNILTFLYKDFIKPHKRILLIVILAVIFTLAAYYAYQLYAIPVLESATGGRDVSNANSRPSEMEIYLFSAGWCPHCRRATPEWKAFKESYDGKTVGNYTIKAIDVDCTDGTSPLIQKHNINGYPTVFALQNGNRVDFDAKISNDSLSKFVESLQQN